MLETDFLTGQMRQANGFRLKKTLLFEPETWKSAGIAINASKFEGFFSKSEKNVDTYRGVSFFKVKRCNPQIQAKKSQPRNPGLRKKLNHKLFEVTPR